MPYPDLDADEHVRHAAAVAGGARGGTVINLYRMLLHSPSLATAWLGLGTHLRYEGQLDDRLRELVICLVARRTDSAYEWHHHAPAARAAGLSDEQLRALSDWEASACFDARERTVLAYAQAVLQEQVDDRLMAGIREELGDPVVVELTALVAYYLGVSRFLAAMAVAPETP